MKPKRNDADDPTRPGPGCAYVGREERRDFTGAVVRESEPEPEAPAAEAGGDE